MPEAWTAEVVGRMHVAGITGQMLANKCGYTAAYLSTVLNGKRGTEQTKEKIFHALDELEKQLIGHNLEVLDECPNP